MIKFRLWDKKECKMIYPGSSSLMEWFIRLDGTLGFHNQCGNVEYNDGESPYTNQFEVIQFTGKLDRNGKEIYGGDIIECLVEFGPMYRHRYEVHWHRHGWWIKEKNGDRCGLGSAVSAEVVGNIYETTASPELKP